MFNAEIIKNSKILSTSYLCPLLIHFCGEFIAEKSEDIIIQDLHCVECAEKVEQRALDIKGVNYAKVKFKDRIIEIRYDSEQVSIDEIRSEIKSIGYEAFRDELGDEKIFSFSNREFIFTFVSGISLCTGLFINFFTNNPLLIELHHKFMFAELFYSLAIVFGGYYIVKRALKALVQKRFAIESLMVIGALGAVMIDAFAEGAAVFFLFSLAELLEEYSVERTRGSLKELIKLKPKFANLKKDGRYISTPVENIKVKDIILVKPGENIGVDGVVVKGNTTVNQAPITGESMPVFKGEGDEVFAGTINQSGSIEVETRKIARESTLAKIIQMVENAEMQKSPTERFIDRFAKYYTPSVVLLAFSVAVIPTFVFNQGFDVWLYKALLLLLISCPCALAISTPVSMSSSITSAARNGVLFKGSVYLEKLAEIDTFAFDKTGTLTEGRPKVTEVIPAGNHLEEEVLVIAVSLERLSDHPIADAITNFATGKGVKPKVVENFRDIVGKGVKGNIDGREYIVGNSKLFTEEALKEIVEKIKALEDEGKTVVIVGQENEAVGIIGIADSIRDYSAEMIREIKSANNHKIVMLTGDNEKTAGSVARQVGVDEYYAELLPEQKVDVIKQMMKNGRKVAMVGDGVNDAPALVTADLGIAMGAAGSDTSIEVADIALMTDDLLKVPYTTRLGRKTMRVVKENIIAAIGIKLLFAILVFPGLVTLWMAVAIGDMGVSLAVILNAMRLSMVK